MRKAYTGMPHAALATIRGVTWLLLRSPIRAMSSCAMLLHFVCTRFVYRPNSASSRSSRSHSPLRLATDSSLKRTLARGVSRPPACSWPKQPNFDQVSQQQQHVARSYFGGSTSPCCFRHDRFAANLLPRWATLLRSELLPQSARRNRPHAECLLGSFNFIRTLHSTCGLHLQRQRSIPA